MTQTLRWGCFVFSRTWLLGVWI